MKKIIISIFLSVVLIAFSGCGIRISTNGAWGPLLTSENSTWVSSDNHIWFSIVSPLSNSDSIAQTNFAFYGEYNYGGSVSYITIATGGSDDFPHSFYIFSSDTNQGTCTAADALLAGDITTLSMSKGILIVTNIDQNKLSDTLSSTINFKKISSPPSWATPVPDYLLP